MVGGLIYLLFRSRSLLLFSWLETLHLTTGIYEIRALVRPLRSQIPNFVLYSIPDGTWLYAYVMFYRLIWRERSHKIMWLWLSLGFIASIGLELAQGMGWYAGTFDWMDITIYALAIFLSLRTSLPDDDPAPIAIDRPHH